MMNWSSLFAIVSILVFLGNFIDWILRKTQRDRILASLAQLEHRLKSTPVQKWETIVARGGIKLYNVISEWIAGKRVFTLFSSYLRTVIVFLFGGAVIDVVLEMNGLRSSMMAPYMLTGVGGIWFTIIKRFTPDSFNKTLDSAFRLMIISSLFSAIALTIGKNFQLSSPSYWFPADESLDTDKQSLLALIYLPFGACTIIIAMWVLKRAISHNWSLGLMGFINIIISYCLAVLLYAIILLLGDMPPDGFLKAMIFSNNWLWHVLTRMSENLFGADDPRLTPFILTAFVPVALYMSVFIFLAFILKPLALAAGYLCGLLSEKQKTPFAELATIISLFIAMLKALNDWDYLKVWL